MSRPLFVVTSYLRQVVLRNPLRRVRFAKPASAGPLRGTGFGGSASRNPPYFVWLEMVLVYACASEADGIISIRSVPGGISFNGSLLRAIHGFVYTSGSSMVTVSSRVFWLTR